MKARSKSEIAMAMGISEKTLRRWLVQHRKMLGSMGVNPNARLLPPKAVRYICEELGIIEEDFR